MLKFLGITAASFVLMELASWLIHKYLMHGPLWNIHRTHHQKTRHALELNDLFSASFGALAVVALVAGLREQNVWLMGAGAGVSVYGLVYFVLHDIFIHRRLRVGGRLKNAYLRGLADAHRDHHKSRERDGAVAFGLLWVPFRYFKSARNTKA